MIHISILITRGDTIGGAQSHIITLAENLLKRKYRVSFIVGGKAGVLTNYLINNGFIVYSVPALRRNINPIFDLISLFHIVQIIREIKPDFLSIHSTKAGIIGRIVCKFLKIPNVFTVHGWSFTEGIASPKKEFFIFFEKLLSKLSKKIIVVSDYDKKLAIKYGICDSEKLVTIHNGINIPVESKRIINNTGIINIVMVARFDTPKDQKSLILAIKNINYVHLHLLGDGPNLIDCKNLVEDLSLSRNVTFYGHMENVLQFLESMDVFVLISKYEAFPISTLEAMSVGLPILISNVGGTSESVFHGSNGFLLDNNDPIHIEKFLKDLVLNVKIRDEMGTNSKRIFYEKFTSDIMVNKTLSVFHDVLNF
jgi:glycosyltransferase involved in cell wall biosynthesis